MGTRGPALELVTDCLEKQDRAQGAVYVGPGVESVGTEEGSD